MLSVNITLLTSLLIFSERGGILSIIARLLDEESSMKSISWELIDFPGVLRFSRQYPFDSSVYYLSVIFQKYDNYVILSPNNSPKINNSKIA